MMNVLNFVAHDMFFRILVAISASFILYSVCLYIRNGFVIQYYQNNSKKYNLVWLFVTANQQYTAAVANLITAAKDKRIHDIYYRYSVLLDTSYRCLRNLNLVLKKRYTGPNQSQKVNKFILFSITLHQYHRTGIIYGKQGCLYTQQCVQYIYILGIQSTSYIIS